MGSRHDLNLGATGEAWRVKGKIMESNKTGRDGFAQVLRAEWTKFRTVRGWVIGMAVAALVTVLPGLLYAVNSHCEGPNGNACPTVPVGPDGEAVTDKFQFVHQPLSEDGSITARVTSLTGIITYPPPNHDEIVSGVVPWAKAGVIIKESVEQGSAYAAVMATGSHGVRMQYNFIEDIAGRGGNVSPESPRWLRLTRSGDTLTGYESTDGTHWTKVGTAHLARLPATVQVGLFVASPCDLTVSQGACRFTQATAVFDHVSLQGKAGAGAWSRDEVGADDVMTDWERFHRPAGVEESGGTFTVTGSDDIAPLGTEGGQTMARTIGALAGLIVVIVVAVLFVTAEYRRGLSGTTLLASPRRGRVLAAKAIVIGTVTFAAGLAGASIVVALGKQILRFNGNYILPVTSLTELRVVVGSAALLAVAAVLALALGAILRRSAAAITAALAVTVLPYILAVASVLPLGTSQWLLRLTPAAAFAIQQSLPEYPQVIGLYTPLMGYYPLAPWAGFAMHCGYTALALGLAVFMLRRRDA
jgi:ABC-type transport system involved in multi-copper enzyme maturation permease subunit